MVSICASLIILICKGRLSLLLHLHHSIVLICCSCKSMSVKRINIHQLACICEEAPAKTLIGCPNVELPILWRKVSKFYMSSKDFNDYANVPYLPQTKLIFTAELDFRMKKIIIQIYIGIRFWMKKNYKLCMYRCIILLFNIKHHPGVKLVVPICHSQVSQENAFSQFREDCCQ